MSGMMGSTGTGASMLLWIFLGVALAVVAGGVVVTLALRTRGGAGPSEVRPAESPAVRQAKDALRLRYANGEISREDYLQGKVELED
jgi:putative membrane protein